MGITASRVQPGFECGEEGRQASAKLEQLVADTARRAKGLAAQRKESSERLGKPPRRVKSKGKSDLGNASSEDLGEWTVSSWLASLPGITGALATTLLRPLGNDPCAEEQLDFIRSLGRQAAHLEEVEGAKIAMHLLQSDETLLQRLSVELWKGMQELAQRRAATSRELQQKFVEEGDVFTMSYGGIDTFFGGLEKLLGPPSPQLATAVMREHCSAADSDVEFTTANYGVTTTSRVEFFFVVDPENGLELTGRKSWPAESKPKGEEGATAMDGREAKALNTFEAMWAVIDERLEKLKEYPLREEEFFCARLYTGPMFTKYNASLRGVGIPTLKAHFEKLCLGNMYTTTLHVINSAVVKLGKLQRAEKVYRGMGGGVLPEQFWTASEHNVRGGCEYGFLSTTTKAEIAMQYAEQRETAGIVFEIQMGMIDRGASLDWLSQYPAEGEILFAPLTGLELKSTRVMGSVLVVEMRLSVNLLNRTIEEVIAKMQTSALGLVELISDDLKLTGAPTNTLEPFDALETECESHEPEYYNASENYKREVERALNLKRDVLQSLTQESVWEEVEPADLAARAQRQRACAAMASREQEHSTAATLLRLSLLNAPLSEESREKMEKSAGSGGLLSECGDELWMLEVAQLCVDQGCIAPWPPTLVQLLASGRSSTLRAGARLVVAQLGAERYRTEGSEVLTHDDNEGIWRAGRVTKVVSVCDGSERPAHGGWKERRGNQIAGRTAVHKKAVAVHRRAKREAEEQLFDVKVGSRTLLRQPSSRVFVPDGGAGVGAVLREASAAGSATLVGELLSLGVPICCVSRTGNTALHRAASTGREQVCRLLVDARADPFLSNAQQASAYEEAVRKGHFGVRRIFSPGLTDEEVSEQAASGPMHAAAAAGDSAALRLAIEGSVAGVDECVVHGVTPLMLAALHGRVAEAKELLDRGAAVNAQSEHGLTPLMLAAEGGHRLLVELCLQRKADVNLASSRGTTPLTQASAFGHHAVVGSLLAANAMADARTHGGWHSSGSTALILACKGGCTEVIHELIRGGASVNATRDDLTTGLMLACNYGHTEAVGVMLHARGDVNLADKRGNTALVMACEDGFDETARALINAQVAIEIDVSCEDGYTALITACHFGHVQTVRMILAARACVSKVDARGMSALMHVCLYPHLNDDEVIKILLRERADVHSSNNDGDQPLHIAAANMHDEATRALLLAKAQPDALGAGGHTPLIIAAMSGFESITSLLLHARASLNIMSNGYTALGMAVREGHHEVKRQLQEYDDRRAARSSPLLISRKQSLSHMSEASLMSSRKVGVSTPPRR